MPSDKPLQRLNDILENIEWIIEYTHGQRYADFARDRLTRDAVERCLLRISEAASKLEGVIDNIASDQRPISAHSAMSFDTNTTLLIRL